MDKFPEKELGDAAHAVAKGIVSAIPQIGGPLSVLLDTVFTAPLEHRRNEWLKLLAEAIQELQEKVEGLDPEKLAKDEAFISTALHAFQIAARTHQKEKLEALRNAVQNSALPNAPEEDVQLMFLRFVDELTPSHLRVLCFLSQLTDSGVLLDDQFPDLACLPGFLKQVVDDLMTRGLSSGSTPLALVRTNSQGALGVPEVGQMGKDFLRYIQKQI